MSELKTKEELGKNRIRLGHKISFISNQKTFLSAKIDGTITKKSSLSPTEEFIIEMEKEKFLIKTTHGTYLTVSKDGQIKHIEPHLAQIIKDGKEEGEKRWFTEKDLFSIFAKDGKVAFKTYNGYFIGAKENSKELKETELFLVHKIGGKREKVKINKEYTFISIHKRHMSARRNQKVTTVPHNKSYEHFTIIQALNNKIAIRTHHHTFIQVKKDGIVTQNISMIDEETHFETTIIEGFGIAFKSKYDTYLSAYGCENNKKVEITAREACSKNEIWEIIKIPQNKISEKFIPTLKHRILAVKSISKLNEKELDEHFCMRMFDEAEQDFGTGDILLFRGTEGFSKLIKVSSISIFSHVMMVVREPSEDVRKAYGISKDEKEKVFVFESDSEIEQHEGGGVQLIPLRKWIELTQTYYHDNKDTLLCWRKLVDFDLKPVEKEFDEFLISMAGKFYKKNKTQLAKALFEWNKKEDLESIFCSELVAAAYKVMKLIPQNKKSNNYVPRDFTSSLRKEGKDLILEEGASLLNEVRIRLYQPDYLFQPEYEEEKKKRFSLFNKLLKKHDY